MHSDGTPRGMGPVMEHSHIVDCVIQYLNSIIVIIHIFRVYTPKMYTFWDLHIPPHFIGNNFQQNVDDFLTFSVSYQTTPKTEIQDK